ncbi:MAG: energy-coupling factor transporter transmembrane component T [Solibacillus sp.]
MNVFSTFHPLLLSIYYCFVLVILYCLHPVVAMLALIGAIAYFCALTGWRLTLKELVFYSFIFLFVMIAYPSFVHNGYTPLFFLNDLPITYEAIIKAGVTATIIVSIAFWSKSYFEMFTTTKILFLASMISTKLGIFLSMLLRFIPIFKQHWQERQLAQKAIGYYHVASQVEKLQRFVVLWSSTLMFTIEFVFFKPAVMRARGYGVGKRTQFQLIRFTKKDALFAVFLFISMTLFALFFEYYAYHYYPKLKSNTLSSSQIFMIAIFMLLPAMYELKENAKWIYLQSKI